MRFALGIFLIASVALADWEGFPMYAHTNVTGWTQAEQQYNISSQIWHAAMQRYIAGDLDQNTGDRLHFDASWLYDIVEVPTSFTDNVSYTNWTTNIVHVYTNMEFTYDTDVWPIEDIVPFQTNVAYTTETVTISIPVEYGSLLITCYSVNFVQNKPSDNIPVERYVEWAHTVDDGLNLDTYFGTPGTNDFGVTNYPTAAPFMSTEGVWTRHNVGPRSTNYVYNRWGLLESSGASDGTATGGSDPVGIVSSINMPYEMGSLVWVPDMVLSNFWNENGLYHWDDELRGWTNNTLSAYGFQPVMFQGYYDTNIFSTNALAINVPGFYYRFGLANPSLANVEYYLRGSDLGVSNTWRGLFSDEFSSVYMTNASADYADSGRWVWREKQQFPGSYAFGGSGLYNRDIAVFPTNAFTLSAIYSSTGSLPYAVNVSIDGHVVTNWDSGGRFDIKLDHRSVADVVQTNWAYDFSEEPFLYLKVTNAYVDSEGSRGDSISIRYVAPTNAYIFDVSPLKYSGPDVAQMDTIFRALNALAWYAPRGTIAAITNDTTPAGTYTWSGYGWSNAKENMVTNSTLPVASGAVLHTSPDPNWVTFNVPSEVTGDDDYDVDFVGPNDYRVNWNFEFKCSLDGTIILTNNHTTLSRDYDLTIVITGHDTNNSHTVHTGTIGPEGDDTITLDSIYSYASGLSTGVSDVVKLATLDHTLISVDGDVGMNKQDFTASIAYRYPYVFARRWSSIASFVGGGQGSPLGVDAYTNQLYEMSTDRDVYLMSADPNVGIYAATNFVFDPELEGIRYDSTNMVGMYTLVTNFIGTSAAISNTWVEHIGSLGKDIPYEDETDVYNKGWRYVGGDNYSGYYLIKYDNAFDQTRVNPVSNKLLNPQTLPVSVLFDPPLD